MKTGILCSLLGLIIIFRSMVYGQSTFEYISAKVDTDQFVADAVCSVNGEMIFVGTNQTGSVSEGHILTLSKNGEQIREKFFSRQGKNTSLGNILPVGPNRFLVIGSVAEQEIHNLLVCLIDTALNEVCSKEFSLGSYNYLYAKSFKDHDNNVIIHGTVSDTVTFYDIYPYLFKISPNLDSIRLKILDGNAWGIFDMVEKSNLTGYYLFLNPNYTVKYQGPAVLSIDAELNVVKTQHLPRAVENYHTIKWISDSTYIFSGEYVDLNGNAKTTLGAVVADTFMAEKFFNHFGEDTVTNFPGLRRNLDFITPNQIYIGGTTNFGYTTVFMKHDSWFFLNKIDSTLTISWQKIYGKPGFYYTLWGVLAIDDGGCVMYGTRYHYPSDSFTRDIYILKVDKHGYTVSINDDRPTQDILVKLYPNPGSDEVFIQSDLTNAVFELMDNLGREVCRTNLMSKKTRIATGNLDSGLYLYKIIHNKMVVGSGKWIKY